LRDTLTGIQWKPNHRWRICFVRVITYAHAQCSLPIARTVGRRWSPWQRRSETALVHPTLRRRERLLSFDLESDLPFLNNPECTRIGMEALGHFRAGSRRDPFAVQHIVIDHHLAPARLAGVSGFHVASLVRGLCGGTYRGVLSGFGAQRLDVNGSLRARRAHKYSEKVDELHRASNISQVLRDAFFGGFELGVRPTEIFDAMILKVARYAWRLRQSDPDRA